MTKNNAQTDIFSIFNLVDEHSEMKKQEEAAKLQAEKEEREVKAAAIKEKAANAKSKAKKPEKKPEHAFKPNEETIIRYYGESLEITAYFTPEELAEGLLVHKKDSDPERKPLEPEMLRKRMEKDFPELVKDHTEIIFLKDKNIIVPTMKAKKKGNCGNVLSSDSTSPFLPKIPFAILQDFIALAKLYGEYDLEVHADIYYRTEKKEYFLDIPEQMVHTLWTEVTEDSTSIVERVQDAIKVVEIHSHHSMAPIPSKLDDSSERVPGMHYAIVGHTNSFFPEVYLRLFVSNAVGHISKDVSCLFECPFQQLPSFDINSIEVYGE